MQQRYYDPVIGRFYSNDPIGFRDTHSFNRYVYANNNPYKFVDPDGQENEFAALGLVFAAAGTDLATPDPTDAAAPVKVAGYAGAVIGTAVGGTLYLAYNALTNNSDSSSEDSGSKDGKKAKDSSKNSKHGKNGRAGKGVKAQEQVADLEEQLKNAEGKKDRDKIKQKLKNIKKNNDRKNTGEEHGKRDKKPG